jgi:hypothetical protein
MKHAMKLIAAVLAIMLLFAIPTAGAEMAEAEKLKNYEKFEEVAFYAEIPDSIMYVTMYSPEDAPLYERLAKAGYTYDSFREFMSTNDIVAYGLFVEDGMTEFQIAAKRQEYDIDLSATTEAELQTLLAMSGNGLEAAGAEIEESGIYRGTNYTGFWFHYKIRAVGFKQGVIQYTLLHGDRAINIRGYNMLGKYPAEIEETIKEVFDSIIVN